MLVDDSELLPNTGTWVAKAKETSLRDTSVQFQTSVIDEKLDGRGHIDNEVLLSTHEALVGIIAVFIARLEVCAVRCAIIAATEASIARMNNHQTSSLFLGPPLALCNIVEEFAGSGSLLSRAPNHLGILLR